MCRQHVLLCYPTGVVGQDDMCCLSLATYIDSTCCIGTDHCYLICVIAGIDISRTTYDGGLGCGGVLWMIFQCDV